MDLPPLVENAPSAYYQTAPAIANPKAAAQLIRRGVAPIAPPKVNALDPRSLSGLKAAVTKKAPTDGDLKAAGQQVDSMFIQGMLKDFRKSGKSMESGLFKSNSEDTYYGMLDQQLGADLSVKGIGIGKFFEDQLRQQLNAGKKPGDAVAAKHKNPGELSVSDKRHLSLRPQVPTTTGATSHEHSPPSQDREQPNSLDYLIKGIMVSYPAAGASERDALSNKEEDPFVVSPQEKTDLEFYSPLNEIVVRQSLENSGN